MLKPDCAPAVEEPLPVLAGAAPVLTAEDAGLERVTPRPADEPAAVPEAPTFEVPCKASVADPRLHCESEQPTERVGKGCTHAEVEAEDEALETTGGPWMVKLGVWSKIWPAFLECCSVEEC